MIGHGTLLRPQGGARHVLVSSAPEVGRQRDGEVGVAAVQLQQVGAQAAGRRCLRPAQHVLAHDAVRLREGALHLQRRGNSMLLFFFSFSNTG